MKHVMTHTLILPDSYALPGFVLEDSDFPDVELVTPPLGELPNFSSTAEALEQLRDGRLNEHIPASTVLELHTAPAHGHPEPGVVWLVTLSDFLERWGAVLNEDGVDTEAIWSEQRFLAVLHTGGCSLYELEDVA